MRRRRRLGKFLALSLWCWLGAGPLAAQDWLPPEEVQLPPGVINVVLPDFGDHIGGGDYGLANQVPVEVREDVSPEQRIRLVRTLQALKLSRRNQAHFQILLGQVEVIWFWLEAPPVHGQWRVQIFATYADRYQEPVFAAQVKPEVVQYCYVPPHALLDIRISSIEQTFRLSKRFLFTLMPARLVLWREHQPFPRRDLWD